MKGVHGAFRRGWTAKAALEGLRLNWILEERMSGKSTTSRDCQRGEDELLGFAK